MRNIDEYTDKYLEHSFEQYQVKYRMKNIASILENYT